MLSQVRRWLELNAEGRLAWFHRAIDDRSPTKGLRAGFRKLVGPNGRAVESNADHVGAYGIDGPSEADALDSLTEFLLLPEVFDSEVCQGLETGAEIGGLILHDHAGRDRRPPGGSLRLDRELDLLEGNRRSRSRLGRGGVTR